ncbi:hypothetical protein CGSMWGv1500E_05296 [Gardnerella vaginalis 1500E]|uniref:Uncharacterized protein n=2 Tax=Gardnerella TaxID=2701 RepID=I4LYD1_GARVA|nr:hypothetical protein CGSMWGv1500E_05296 [Gardnerella vaginalis 1500E]EIK85856.1 hypothetical protein CGSMWGv00703Dmash_02110 [Gardnerella greenwoodii 00703Dmash]
MPCNFPAFVAVWIGECFQAMKQMIKKKPGGRKPAGAERKREEGFNYGVRERTSLMANH